MKRKDFLKKSMLGIAAGSIGLSVSGKAEKTSADTNESSSATPAMKEPKYIHHPALSRGEANHGWLKSYHSFSFANYHNPQKMNFGLLRVLNDDTVAAGRGFGTHPHDNMEIVSIPLYGDLEHKDSMGNTTVIRQGDVQIMSAGTGVFHSEYNKNEDQEVKFLQIWVFPKERNIEPRYGQRSYPAQERKGIFKTVVSPETDDDAVWINQDAWFSLGRLTAGQETDYAIRKQGNGVYAFVIEGEVEIDGHTLGERDALGVSETDRIQIKAGKEAEVLLIDVPMGWG